MSTLAESGIVLLTGFNRETNEAWIQDMEIKFSEFFNPVKLITYEHWIDPTLKEVAFKKEQTKLKEELSAISSIGRTPYVFAKSIGTVITMSLLMVKEIKPKACVFVGTPIEAMEQAQINFKNALLATDVPILFIYKTNEKYGPFSEFSKIVKSAANPLMELREVPGDGHNYSDIIDLEKMALEFYRKYE